MTEKKFLHKGFESTGEESNDNGFNDFSEIELQRSLSEPKTENLDETDLDRNEEKRLVTDCTILWSNGQYQKPNVVIKDRKFRFTSKSQNIRRIQMRSVNGGGVRYYSSLGLHRIPNGEYVLSLWGGTYPYAYIKACIKYTE
jgi:hypothetical protein